MLPIITKMPYTTIMKHLLVIVLLLAVPLTAFAAESAPQPLLQNPISCPDVICVFLQVIRLFLGALAAFATFMFTYGGFLFLSSGGNEEQVKKGKETLTWATLGLVTILGSWVVIRFILESTAGVQN